MGCLGEMRLSTEIRSYELDVDTTRFLSTEAVTPKGWTSGTWGMFYSSLQKKGRQELHCSSPDLAETPWGPGGITQGYRIPSYEFEPSYCHMPLAHSTTLLFLKPNLVRDFQSSPAGDHDSLPPHPKKQFGRETPS